MQYSAHRLHKAWRRTTHVAAAVLFVAGCGGGSGDDDDDLILTDTGQDGRIAQMRFINMIPDSPIVEMLHEGTSSARFTELLPFGTGSNRNDFITGDFFFNLVSSTVLASGSLCLNNPTSLWKTAMSTTS